MQIDRNAPEPVQTGFVPTRKYTCLIKEVTNKKASTGTEYTELKCQIVAPDEVEQAGSTFKTAGTNFELNFYFTEKSTRRSLDDLKRLGLKTAESAANTKEVQEELLSLKGFYFDMTLDSRPRYKRMALTPGEIAAGKKSWDAEVVKGEDGKNLQAGFEISAQARDIAAGTLRGPDGSEPY